MTLRIGVIGGTGLYAWDSGPIENLETPFGTVSLERARVGKKEILFLPRHGPRHTVPPHRINARAQVRAFAASEVDYVLGLFAVGAIDPAIPAGSRVVPSDFLDLTRQRALTFHDEGAVHADMTEPFCPHARGALLRSADRATRDGGVYATTEGPRFETVAERAMLERLGAHVVGMTLAPEAVLAREAGLCYAALCFVANGAPESGGTLDPARIQQDVSGQATVVRAWIVRSLEFLPAEKTCLCRVRGLARSL